MLSLSLYSHQVWYGMLQPKSEKKRERKRNICNEGFYFILLCIYNSLI